MVGFAVAGKAGLIRERWCNYSFSDFIGTYKVKRLFSLSDHFREFRHGVSGEGVADEQNLPDVNFVWDHRDIASGRLCFAG